MTLNNTTVDPKLNYSAAMQCRINMEFHHIFVCSTTFIQM